MADPDLLTNDIFYTPPARDYISGVAAVYNRYEYAEEMREALDKWASHLQSIITDNEKN